MIVSKIEPKLKDIIENYESKDFNGKKLVVQKLKGHL
jgi:hypothetical protein